LIAPPAAYALIGIGDEVIELLDDFARIAGRGKNLGHYDHLLDDMAKSIDRFLPLLNRYPPDKRINMLLEVAEHQGKLTKVQTLQAKRKIVRGEWREEDIVLLIREGTQAESAVINAGIAVTANKTLELVDSIGDTMPNKRQTVLFKPQSISAATPKMTWPQYHQVISGQVVVFRNSHEKGQLGDRLTALRLTARGYRKLTSKYDNVRSFDGVYVKRNYFGDMEEIRLIENKVNSSRLNPGPPPQMSDAWIVNNCNKMRATGDPELARTATLVLNALKNNRLERELWHHVLATGTTTVREVTSSGKPQEASVRWQDRLISNEIGRQCRRKNLECQ